MFTQVKFGAFIWNILKIRKQWYIQTLKNRGDVHLIFSKLLDTRYLLKNRQEWSRGIPA